jgi:hypothetical protein
MAGELVQFPAAQVSRHAGSVDQVADAMDAARSAVHDVTMDSAAYGQLCQFLPGILSPVFGAGADALLASVDALRETASALRATVSDMSGTDAGSAQRITSSIELPL